MIAHACQPWRTEKPSIAEKTPQKIDTVGVEERTVRLDPLYLTVREIDLGRLHHTCSTAVVTVGLITTRRDSDYRDFLWVDRPSLQVDLSHRPGEVYG